MMKKVSALLVHGGTGSWRALKRSLEELSVETCEARSLGKARARLEQANPPHLVFTDTVLGDGTWMDVVSLATVARAPANVIIVSPVADVRLYIEAMERGAFDLIVPRLALPELTHVVRSAAESVFQHREAHARLCSTFGADPSAVEISAQEGQRSLFEFGRVRKKNLPLVLYSRWD